VEEDAMVQYGDGEWLEGEEVKGVVKALSEPGEAGAVFFCLEDGCVVEDVEGFDVGGHLLVFGGGDAVALEEGLFLVDAEIVEGDGEVPIRDGVAGGMFPIDDGCDFAFFVEDDVFEAKVAMIEGGLCTEVVEFLECGFKFFQRCGGKYFGTGECVEALWGVVVDVEVVFPGMAA
jgi:hypothetical protein